mgnify:CR=1 FL=1
MSNLFIKKDPSNFTYTTMYGDWGSHNRNDFSFLYVDNEPAGYARLGDVFKWGYINDGSSISFADANSVNIMFVKKGISTSAVPCTGYEKVYTITGSNWSSIVFVPTHTDPNYVALGSVVRHIDNTTFTADSQPPIGLYYLVHRKHLIDRGQTATHFFAEFWMNGYQTIANTNLFKLNDKQKWDLRTDMDLQACCTGSGSDCETWVKGSLSCLNAMSD